MCDARAARVLHAGLAEQRVVVDERGWLDLLDLALPFHPLVRELAYGDAPLRLLACDLLGMRQLVLDLSDRLPSQSVRESLVEEPGSTRPLRATHLPPSPASNQAGPSRRLLLASCPPLRLVVRRGTLADPLDEVVRRGHFGEVPGGYHAKSAGTTSGTRRTRNDRTAI